MKITAIKSYPAWSVWRNVYLVKIETDEGIYGWGEGGTSWRELGVKWVVDHLSPWVIGRDPMAVGRLWQAMCRAALLCGGPVTGVPQRDGNRQQQGRYEPVQRYAIQCILQHTQPRQVCIFVPSPRQRR